MNPKLEKYFAEAKQWKAELLLLRKILLKTDLTEEYKWRQPCYTLHGKNIVIIGTFKAYCVLSFFKGALLQDSQSLLHSPGENSQATRQLRFTSIEDIQAAKDSIQAYIAEAIAIEKSGLKVDFKKKATLEYPEELILKFEESPAFKEAFQALSPGRRRGYLLHFSAGKQSKTRNTRIEKYYKRILSGKGINDCVCGLSRRMPNCDGSHNKLGTKK